MLASLWESLVLRTLRFVGVAMILGILTSFLCGDDQTLKDNRNYVHDYSGLSAGKKVFQALAHAVDEFFDTGRYLAGSW